jgi:glycosyltransferase 2 family protein
MQRFSHKKVIAGIVSAVTISIVTMYVLVRFYDIRGDLGDIITSLSVPYILLLFLIMVAAWLADAFRLRELAGAFGTPIPLKLAMGAVMAGNFSINITPFFAGAGIVHIYVLKRRGLELGTATAAVTGGAMISHFTQGFLALLSLIITRGWVVSMSIPASKPLIFMIMAYLGVILAVGGIVCYVDEPRRTFAFLFRHKRLEKLGHKYFDFHRGLNLLLKGDPWRLFRIFIFTGIYLICFYAATPVILAGLGSPQPLGQIIAFQLLLFFTASLAPTPGSSGAIELGAFSLFALIVPLEILVKFLVWWRIVTFFSNLALGAYPFAYFAFSKNWLTEDKNAAE